MKKGDVFVIMITVVSVLVLMLSSKNGSVAAIYVDGELYRRLPLSVDTVLVVESDYGTNTVVIKDGSVRVTDSDCVGKDCQSEKITKMVRSIVCLPNRLSIIIEESNTKDETDVIV